MLSLNGLKATERAILALDLSEENARVAELEADAAAIQQAIDAAESRCSEIHKTLSDFRRECDGRAVADALLEGGTATDAAAQAPTESDLRIELASLRAGIAELVRRRDDARSMIDDVRLSAYCRATDCAEPLADGIIEELKAAAMTVIQGYAALEVIVEATRGHGLKRMAGSYAISGLYGPDRLLPYQRHVEVPRQVTEVLQLLRGKGASLRTGARTTVLLP